MIPQQEEKKKKAIENDDCEDNAEDFSNQLSEASR